MTRTRSVDELDCVDVREALTRGTPLSPAHAEHAALCPLCSQALTDDGTLEPSEELLAAVEAAVQGERGLPALLRSWPTPSRMLAGASITVLLVVVTTLARPRWAFGPMPLERVTLSVAAIAALLGVVLWLTLRPLHIAPPSQRAVLASLAAGLLAPVALAVAPGGDQTMPVFAGPSTAHGIIACFLFGAATGCFFVLALWALDRGAHGARDVALLAAAGGGLAGNAALELHCPARDPLHLLLGHATVGAVLIAGYALLRLRRSRA